ncbi:MAG: N-glycosylase/DNA lyase [Pyrinomonadaceae bacterium]|nr:N-glycosylase/DNA lyase [Pyrinomonadaceae bacterium]MCX7640752.1 N-glycosylase/DNA lyase [Pyrinomonadaceae bacterium]MDW8304647.1 N-glycosylase/DNA lyase [Acidobacteriota bacterium]
MSRKKQFVEPLTIEKVIATHKERKLEIRARLAEFARIWQSASDEKLWEEMVFCFFTAGCSARMGLRCIEKVRPLLINGSQEEIETALLGSHRYPRARARYIVATREFLKSEIKMQIRQKLASFSDPVERRDWLAKERRIKGLGYKEASHFLRNIGFKGYAILDKHILNSMKELGLIDDVKPPSTRSRYLEIEDKLKNFSASLEIELDEMDLVLWSIKTGEILK